MYVMMMVSIVNTNNCRSCDFHHS